MNRLVFFMRQYWRILVCVCLALTACLFMVPVVWCAALKHSFTTTVPTRFDIYARLCRQLKKGMSQAEVEKLMGRPHNSDTDYVWIWISRPDLLPDDPKARTLSELYAKEHGVWLLFDSNGHLLTPFLIKDDDPWSMLAARESSSFHEVERKIGPMPEGNVRNNRLQQEISPKGGQ